MPLWSASSRCGATISALTRPVMGRRLLFHMFVSLHPCWSLLNSSVALSEHLRESLAEQTSNEMNLSAGEIYFRILRCDPRDDSTVDAWLARLQSSNESDDVRQLL